MIFFWQTIPYFIRSISPISYLKMEKLTQSNEIEVLTLADLTQEELQLLEKAKWICNQAYAPYSNFQVGAAVLLENGEILQSSNQENVSFPAGVCAEQLVLGYAGANFPDQAVKILAIAARRKGDEVWAKVSPCGICRQNINEVEQRFKSPIRMVFLRPDGLVYRMEGIKHLLPLKFDDLTS